MEIGLEVKYLKEIDMKAQANESECGQVNIDYIISKQSIAREKSPS